MATEFNHTKMRSLAVANARIRVEKIIADAAAYGNIAFFVDASLWEAMPEEFRDYYIEADRSSGKCMIKFRV